jgi:hypothetical protein
MSGDSSLLEVVVEPTSSDFESDDPGWRAQTLALRRALQNADIDGLRREEAPSEGYKSGVETLIIALGSSGAITAAVEVLRAWLLRDRSRRLRLRYQEGDRQVDVELDGTTVSDATMSASMTAALERMRHDG